MPGRPHHRIDAAAREPHYEHLEPGKLRLFSDGSGKVRLVIEGDRCYLDVKPARAFPFSAPETCLGLLDDKDKVIGLIGGPEDLDMVSRQTLRNALERRYFLPNVTRVLQAKEEFGAVYCDVLTDRGPRHFVAKGMRDTIRHLGNGELLISDVDGNRYRIENWQTLDAPSRRLLERLL